MGKNRIFCGGQPSHPLLKGIEELRDLKRNPLPLYAGLLQLLVHKVKELLDLGDAGLQSGISPVSKGIQTVPDRKNIAS